MPIFKNRTAFEVYRDLKVFFNLDAGVIRGNIPGEEPEQTAAGGGPGPQELERAREGLKAQQQENARLRAELDRARAAQNGSAVPSGSPSGVVRPESMVWMFGMARTGSTWLSNMMGDLEGFSRWNEPLVGALFGHQYYVRVWDKQRNSKNFILANDYRDSWLNSIRGFVTSEATARFPEVADGSGFLVVKEPNGSVGAPLLMDALPESRMIFLIRDPRDVVASSVDGHREGGWASGRRKKEGLGAKAPDAQVKSSAKKYLQFIGNSKEAYDAHRGPKSLVRYEDLRVDAPGTMKRVFADLGLPAEEAALTRVAEAHAWENIPEEKKGSGKFFRKATPEGWREDLTPEQVVLVEEITGPLMEEFYTKAG